MIVVSLKPPAALRAYPEIIRRTLPDIAQTVHDEIETAASRELTSSGADYKKGLSLILASLSPSDMTRGERTFATILLTGWLPNAVEHGWEGGDMKPALLSGRNVKVGNSGVRYNVIAFRHMTPGTSGRSGPAMGSTEQKPSMGGMSRSQAEQLGRRVHKAAAKLDATTSKPNHGVVQGERLKAGTAGAKPLTNRKSGYQHKSDIYAGMQKEQKTYGSGRPQSSYGTFRMVSDNSDPASWHHPGIIRHGFFDKTAKRIPGIASMAWDSAFVSMARASRRTGV